MIPTNDLSSLIIADHSIEGNNYLKLVNFHIYLPLSFSLTIWVINYNE